MSVHVRVNKSKMNAADKLTVTKLNKRSEHIKFRLLRLLYGTFFLSFHFIRIIHTHTLTVQLLGNIFVHLNVVKLTKNQLMYNDRCSVVASDRSKCEINIYTHRLVIITLIPIRTSWYEHVRVRARALVCTLTPTGEI